jgi:hypothetical protein
MRTPAAIRPAIESMAAETCVAMFLSDTRLIPGWRITSWVSVAVATRVVSAIASARICVVPNSPHEAR